MALCILGVLSLDVAHATPTTNSTNQTLISTIPNTFVPWPGKSMTINIGKYFPDPFLPTNASVNFPSNSVYVNTSLGDFYIQLFPTNAPNTVANFLRYVTNGLYNGMTVHRSVPGFVIQTGGYEIYQSSSGLNYNTIPVFTKIQGEPGISNLRGTVAMALSSGPNSGTDQWFINLTNNSSLLDGTNDGGPFTVFGQVVGTNGMASVDAIATLTIGNYNSPFDSLPLNNWSINSTLAYSNLVVVSNMVATIPSAVCSSTNTFSLELQGTNLVITPLSKTTSPAIVYLNTVDTNGKVLSKTFRVATKKFPQTIDFPFNYATYSTNTYTLTNYPTLNHLSGGDASGLPISIAVASGPASVSTVVTNNVTNSIIHLKGAGIVRLVANQRGDQIYNAAPATTGYLIVNRAPQSITFPSLGTPKITNFPASLNLATNFPTSTSGLPVKVTIASGPAVLKGQMLTISGSGTISLVASQPGNANYYYAPSLTNNLVIPPSP